VFSTRGETLHTDHDYTSQLNHIDVHLTTSILG